MRWTEQRQPNEASAARTTKPRMNSPAEVSRRQFLQSSSAAAAASSLAVRELSAQGAASGNSSLLRIGLIGCGGRGTGAASQALMADSNVKLVAVGDAFRDRLDLSLETLGKQKEITDKLDVPETRRFVGFDAYQKVIASGVDVVLLTTPPHFRPIHIKAAIDAGQRRRCGAAHNTTALPPDTHQSRH